MLCLALASGTPAPSRWLTPRERTMWAAHRDPVRRREWLLGRIAAKRAVGALAHVGESHRIEVRVDRRGAPSARIRRTDGSKDRVRYAISITHCDGHAVAAASRTARVGVDLERPRAFTRKYVRYFLTPRERALLETCDPTVLWTVKEAAWKAIGCGIETPLHALELCVDRMGQVRRIVLNKAAIPASVAVIYPTRSYVLALVTIGVNA